MNSYIDKLKRYIQEHPIEFGESVDSPCLDALWWHYSEQHSLNNDKIRQQYHDLHALLPPETADEAIGTVGCLCAEHERIAFIAGLRLGAQLMLELSGSDIRG